MKTESNRAVEAKKENEKELKVVKTQSYIKEPTQELKGSLESVQYAGRVLGEWARRKPKSRAALVMAVEDDKLCFYKMAYTKQFSDGNPDLAFALHMGCVLAGADSSLYAAMHMAIVFCKQCWDEYEKNSSQEEKESKTR